MNASSTVTFTTTVNMNDFYRKKIEFAEFYRKNLVTELVEISKFKFLRIFLLKRKIEALDNEIEEDKFKLSIHKNIEL